MSNYGNLIIAKDLLGENIELVTTKKAKNTISFKGGDKKQKRNN